MNTYLVPGCVYTHVGVCICTNVKTFQNVERCWQGSAKYQINWDSIYAAKQGMMAYNNNTMRNHIPIEDVGRGTHGSTVCVPLPPLLSVD